MPAAADTDTDESILLTLKPRHEPTADEINDLLANMKKALEGALAQDFLKRMVFNHDVRHSWWPGQTDDARKWVVEGRKLQPGQAEVFPWNGCADRRPLLVDKLIREHNDFKRLALQRRTKNVGARNLSPDIEPEARAALWSQTDQYYEDVTRREWNTAAAQWSDIAEEYGHGVLYVGWTFDLQTVKREMSMEKLKRAAASAAVLLTQQARGEDADELSAEESYFIQQNAWAKLHELMTEDDQRKVFAEFLMSLDEQMPKDEAMRLAGELKDGRTAHYYAVDQVNPRPDFRALTPMVDVVYSPTVGRLAEAPCIYWAEWVYPSALRGRAKGPMPYDADWVEEVLKSPGRSLELSAVTGLDKFNWVLSCGKVRSGESSNSTDKANTACQIIHCYYRASAVGGVPAMYHTVVSHRVPGKYGFHECCENKHGKHSFIDHVREPEATLLVNSRGCGEVSASEQFTIKTHVDLLDDNASIKIKPPVAIPILGQAPNLKPGGVNRMMAAAGMGMVEKIDIGGDAKDAMTTIEVANALFDEYWARGPKADPEAKMAKRQMLVSDFLRDVEAAKELAFQVIQQYSPTELRAGFVGGLPVSLEVSDKELQGQFAIELDFDVSEMDPGIMERRMKNVGTLLQIDNENLLKREPILRALASFLLPAHFKNLVANSQQQGKEEVSDEQRIVSEILNGTQFDEAASYVVGTNHAVRKQVIERIFGVQTDQKGRITGQMAVGPEGQPSRAQSLFGEDPDIQQRVAKRLQFHAFQMTQQQNAATGKLGVEVDEEAA